jgi:TrmH family RNA methyltransferase
LPTSIQFDRVNVVLVDVRNPLNIGAAARAMSNFGFSRLRLVNPYEIAFRNARSAVGAAETLERAEVYKTVAEAVGECSLVVGTTAVRHRDLQHDLVPVMNGASIIRVHLAAGEQCALLFGSEKFGLSNEEMSHCHWLMHIPTREDHCSMNLGQAVAICLYELARDPELTIEPRTASPALSGDIERITDTLLEALRASEYPKLNTSKSFHSAVRRVIRRLRMQKGDAELVLGMLRQIIWKLNKGKVEKDREPSAAR